MKRIILALAVLFFGYGGCIVGCFVSGASLNIDDASDYFFGGTRQSRYLGTDSDDFLPLFEGIVVALAVGGFPGSLLGSIFGAYWAGKLCGYFDAPLKLKWIFLGVLIAPAILVFCWILLTHNIGPMVSLRNSLVVGLAIGSLTSPVGATIGTVIASHTISPKNGDE